MKLHFDNGEYVNANLAPGLVADELTRIYRHLQHVSVVSRKWDNPFYLENATLEQLVGNLIAAGDMLGIAVDKKQCIPFKQDYYNYLHKIYEKNYTGKSEWLDFHEQIHLCEFYNVGSTLKAATIDFRERAGPLIKSFNQQYLSSLTTYIEPGAVYIEWSELGKTPYDYWVDGEPDNLERLCELAKPWLKFRPKLRIATRHINTMSYVKPEFANWWKRYESDWCRHWQLDSWSVENMHSVIKVGNIIEFNSMIELFRTNSSIVKVSLS